MKFRFQIRTCSYVVVDGKDREDARQSVVENADEYINTRDNDIEISAGEEWGD